MHDACRSLDAEFDRLRAGECHPLIAPERLIRASLLQILNAIRSERQFMEQMGDNLLYRWLVGLGIHDAVWVPTVFTKDRDRLLTTDMSRKIMAAILAPKHNALSVRDDPSDPPNSVARAEQRSANDMLHRHSPGSTRRLTPATDRGYDSSDFVAELRQMVVTPHLAQKSRHSAIDGRTTRRPGHAKPQRRRKMIEEPFGWARTVGDMAQTMYRGIKRVRTRLTMAMAACNLARSPKLLAA